MTTNQDTTTLNDCVSPGCNVLATGVCSLGTVPPADCQFYKQTLLQQAGAEDPEDFEDSEGHTPVEFVALAHGKPLTFEEVTQFLCWRPAKLITVIGDRDSGKSTLLCSIYECFLRGPFAGYDFCSSRTLVGFEIRSHYGRVESGRTEPETQRTAMLEGLKYYHLAVKPSHESSPRIDLLFSDRAGEVYRQARGKSDVIPTLVELSNTNYVVLLLDGARVVDLEARSGAMQSIRQTLRALLDSEALSQNSTVQIVMTKLDVYKSAADDTELVALVNAFKLGVSRDFGGRLRSLTFFEVAARDPTGHHEAGFGVDALFRNWTTEEIVPFNMTSPTLKLSTEFDKLLVRQEADSIL